MNVKLVENIKKLLELSSSPFPAQAELARARAKTLMAEYGISLIEDKSEEIIERLYTYSRGSLNRDFQIALISITGSIAQLFNCMILIRQDKPLVIGLETNVEVTFHALDCVLHSLWFDYLNLRKQNPSATFSINFWNGASEALSTRFRPKLGEQKNEVGIVIYDKTREWIHQKYPHLGSWNSNRGTSDSKRGFDSGLASGSQAQLRHGVRSANTGKLLGPSH